MRADRGLLVTVLTVVALWAFGYVLCTLSAGVHPGPAPPTSARLPERDV